MWKKGRSEALTPNLPQNLPNHTRGVTGGAERIRRDAHATDGRPAVKQIIAPVDTLDTSKQALGYVRLFAERFGSKVTLLHAEDVPIPFGTLDPLSSYEPLTPVEESEIAEQIREHADDRLHGMAFDVLV